jgi:hypothetical protein
MFFMRIIPLYNTLSCHIKTHMALLSVHSVHFFDFINNFLFFVYTLQEIFLNNLTCFIKKLWFLSQI